MAESLIKTDRYKAGDTYTFSTYMVSGIITLNSTQIIFEMTVPKSFNGVSSMTFTEISVRTINGRINVSQSDIATTTFTVHGANQFRVVITLNNAINVATNTPMGAQIGGTITFS